MQIRFHRSFKKRYKQIPLNVCRQFNERLCLFTKDSQSVILNNHPLVGDRSGQWSINITGNWRALYFFQDKTTVIFFDIDTHSNLYQ